MDTRIGFIGLGIMGRGMARNLLKAGFPLGVWNRTASRMDELAAEGAGTAANPAELAAGCEIVFTCVSNTEAVEAVLFGEHGAAAGARPGTLMVDMSTISPTATRAMAARLEAQGLAMLDAPVSGGSEGAARGTLTVMIGGPADQTERAMPALRAMGKNIVRVGDHGAGQLAKLVNQILVVGHALAMSEALIFAQAAGLDLRKTLEAVSTGAAGSWMLSNRGPQILDRDWRPGFMIDLQQKDVRLALDAADEMGIPMLCTSLVFNLYRVLQAEGLGREGNHALIKALEKLSGVEVKAA